MKITLLSLACGAALMFSGCASSHSRTVAWEYKVLDAYTTSNIEKTLNALAQDGWIVVTSSASVESGNTPRVQVILKRQKK